MKKWSKMSENAVKCCVFIWIDRSLKCDKNRQWLDFMSGVFVMLHEALGVLIPIFQDSLVSRTCQELMDAGQ